MPAAPAGTGAVPPNVYVDISDYLEIKLKAHACHVSQARPAPHHGSLENLERWPASVAPDLGRSRRSVLLPPLDRLNCGFRIAGMAGSEGQDGETRPGAACVGIRLRIIRFVTNLPRNKVTDVVGYQLLKSGTSIVVPATGRQTVQNHATTSSIGQQSWRRRPPKPSTGWKSARVQKSAKRRSATPSARSRESFSPSSRASAEQLVPAGRRGNLSAHCTLLHSRACVSAGRSGIPKSEI